MFNTNNFLYASDIGTIGLMHIMFNTRKLFPSATRNCSGQ